MHAVAAPAPSPNASAVASTDSKAGNRAAPEPQTPAWMVAVAPLDDVSPEKAGPPAAAATDPQSQAAPAPSARVEDAPKAGAVETAASEPGAPKPDPADPLMGVTTLLVRVGPGVETIDDLNGRKVAVGYVDAARQAAVAATFRGLSLTPDLLTLRPDEAERLFQAGEVKGIVTLADSAAAAQAPDTVLKLRLEPYVVRQLRRPPS